MDDAQNLDAFGIDTEQDDMGSLRVRSDAFRDISSFTREHRLVRQKIECLNERAQISVGLLW